MKSYCVKERKQTECVPGSEKYVKAKNGRLMMKCKCSSCGITKVKFVKNTKGGKIDIHSLIGKLPRPKKGYTPGSYKFMGPYNDLGSQLDYNPKTGEIIKYNVKPHNKVDEISANHDVCYDMGKNKGECDRTMVKSLDEIPYGQMPKWGQTARFLINTKQKLGLGVKKKSKNLRAR